MTRAASNTMIKAYYNLAKPGIVYGNALTTLAAFLFASRFHAAPTLFIATMLGIAFVIASACVFNNYLDRGIDAKMARTKDRALATGAISSRNALIYGTLLGLIGFALLTVYVNLLTADVALFGYVMYVIPYGYAKRASSWGTIVGSISGAVPIVVGYTAVTNQLDLIAVILFLILALWQMPHFYAIALYRKEEYASAGIPVLPIKKGALRTKISIIGYILAFIPATALLFIFGFAGYVYLIVVLLLGLWWLTRALRGLKATDDVAWARGVFRVSLIVLLGVSFALAVAPLLP